MTHRIRLLRLVTVIAIACGLQAHAAERHFIWKVSSAQGAIYLVGSVHILNASYYPLASVFTTAFEESDRLVEEVNLAEMMGPPQQMQLLMRGRLPAGTTIDGVISPEALVEVKRAIEELGLPFEPLRQFKPWMLAITLEGMATVQAGFDNDFGVDKHFYDMAVASKKAVEGLETVEYQISRFDELSAELQERLLLQTVKELGQTKETVTKAADAWKAGDVEMVQALVLDDMKSDPLMYQRLLVERNRAWVPRLEALLRRPRPSFVVVGAAHLVGDDSVIAMLRAKGYRIAQL
jgi:uncharacterized protein YbaP (TraB family)